MKTRGDRKKVQELKQSKSKTKKPTKAQIVKQKKLQAEAKNKNLSKGKKQKIQVKVDVTVSVDKNDKGGKKGKKQKEQRVKSKSKPKKNQKVQVSKDTKRSQSVKSKKQQPKKQIAKNNKKQQDKKPVKTKSIDAKAKSVDVKIQQKKDQPKARKVPESNDNDVNQKIQVIKTVVMKGKVPVDQYFPQKDYHVLEYQGKIYSATLNQTNVMSNNNKFYLIQILQHDTNPQHCYFFTRWGRVGATGQYASIGIMPINSAIMNYNSKLYQKNKKGDYRQIELNYENQDEQKKQKQQEQKKKNQQANQSPQTQSKLPKSVQNLMQLIFDMNMMNKYMVQIGYDVNKMPLGKLSKENIKKGYGILKQLYQQIQKNKRKQVIINLTNDFYSFIPHDFGFNNMARYILDTQFKVKSKIEMLEALAQIKVATTLLSQKKEDGNKIDSNYSKLNRDISPVDRTTNQFKVINDYLHTTHGRHHTSYSLEIVDLFRVQSATQNVRYTKDIDNKMLLWHGSRLTNFVGILSQGLRIAPPQAPVTGYMFGKGVYFADMSSKSANYCFTSRDNNTGILLLCEVALGNMNQKTHADYYAANLPPNKHSTKGIGKIQPDVKNQVELQQGVKIPMGPGIQSNDPGMYLRYNQFIVYDIAQVKIKYILRTKFNYY